MQIRDLGSNRDVKFLIEPMESRLHLSATTAALDDWTSGHASRISVPRASSNVRFDDYLFTVGTSARFQGSLHLSHGGTGSLQLEDSADEAAFGTAFVTGGVIPAGTYDLRVTSDCSYVLTTKSKMTAAAPTLFADGLASAAAGRLFITASPVSDLSEDLGTLVPHTARQFVSSVSSAEDFKIKAHGYTQQSNLIFTLQSPQANALSLRVGLYGEPALVDARVSTTLATSRYKAVDDEIPFSIVDTSDQPIAFRLIISLKPIPSPPYDYNGSGGAFGTTAVLYTANPVTPAPLPDIATLLTTDATAGWDLTSPEESAADHWAFATDGSGIRTMSVNSKPVALPFTWTATASDVFVRFSNAVTEDYYVYAVGKYSGVGPFTGTYQFGYRDSTDTIFDTLIKTPVVSIG